jgi:phosphonate transport system substrate-binding protein
MGHGMPRGVTGAWSPKDPSVLKITIRSALALLFAWVLGGCQDAPASEPDPSLAKPTVRVTGIPDENPTELQRKFAPMTAWLSQALDANVEYIPVTDYGAAVQALVADRIDFAWLGGFTHVQARSMAKVEPLVMRAIDREFKSVFIAHSAAGIKTVGDMRGRTFAFGSKSSTSGHLMPRHYLATTYDLDPEADFDGEPVFSGAHDATAKMVESGRVSAGALNSQVWDRMIKDGGVDPDRVLLIWTTPGYVDYVWTARTALDPALKTRFRDAFLALNASNAQDLAILELQGARSFVGASASDFDAIEGVARSTGLLRDIQ